MKRKLGIITLLILTILATTPQFQLNAAEDPDKVFVQPDDHLPGQHNIRFSDSYVDFTSSLFNPERLKDTSLDPTCSSLADKNCGDNIVRFDAILPFCSAAEKTNCVDEVGAISSSGTKVTAIQKLKFPKLAQNEFKGSPEQGLPSGTSHTVVEIPGVSHSGGSDYIAGAFISGTLNKLRSELSISNFALRITPVRIVPSTVTCNKPAGDPVPCVDSGFAPVIGADGVRRWSYQGPGWDGKQACAVRSLRENLCAEMFGFPNNFKFFFQVRTSVKVTGWLHGRVFEPNISITKDKDDTVIRVEGSPVKVPMIYKANYWKDLPENIRKEYDPANGQLIGGEHSSSSRIPLPNQNDPLTRNITRQPSPSSFSGIRELQLWLPYLSDKATTNQSSWTIRTLSTTELSNANRCFTDPSDLNGIVASNSTQYSAGPPRFNQSNQSLDYQVAAPHFDSVGTLNKGQYSLLMRSSVARCIYGFSNAPIRAELTVFTADGSPQVASLAISESNGWLRLNSFNFEYSAPIIKAVLTQETPTPTASATESPSPQPTVVAPSPSPTKNTNLVTTAKRTTIICTKGKLTKRVTAVKPKCPAGYKKK